MKLKTPLLVVGAVAVAVVTGLVLYEVDAPPSPAQIAIDTASNPMLGAVESGVALAHHFADYKSAK